MPLAATGFYALLPELLEAAEAVPFEQKLCGRFGDDEIVLCAVADTVAEESLLKERIERYLAEISKGACCFSPLF